MIKRVFTKFRPSIHGLHFSNNFSNLNGLTRGRCGGMAFAGMDYFNARLPVPFCRSSDFYPSTVPPDSTPLAQYIWDRMMDSFYAEGATFVSWTAASDADVARWTREQATKLMGLLSNGPVVLGLVGPYWFWNVGQSHQVVAYGYEQDQDYLRIFIWDNNYPDDDNVTLSLSMADREQVFEHVKDANTQSWRGFFVEKYVPKMPIYQDLVVTTQLEPETYTPRGYALFKIRYTVTNQGVYPATANYSLSWTGPNGNAMEHYLPVNHKVEKTLEPGESYEHAVSFFFPQIPGKHLFTPAAVPYFSNGNGRIPFNDAVPVAVDAKSAIVLEPRYEVISQVTRAGANGLEGAYEVRLQAGIQNLTPPITVNWLVDRNTPGELSASGNPAILTVPVGSSPGPYKYKHPAVVTASAADGSATKTFDILLPNARFLKPIFDSPYSKSASSEPFSRVQNTGNQLTITARTFYSQLHVKLEGDGIFGPLANVQWSPTPIQDLGDGSAVFALPPQNPPKALGDSFGPSPFSFIDVTVKCTDTIGQNIIVTSRIMPFMISQWQKNLPPLVRKLLPPWWEWDVQWENPVVNIGDQRVLATKNGLVVADKKFSLLPTDKNKVVNMAAGLPFRPTVILARWVADPG